MEATKKTSQNEHQKKTNNAKKKDKKKQEDQVTHENSAWITQREKRVEKNYKRLKKLYSDLIISS